MAQPTFVLANRRSADTTTTPRNKSAQPQNPGLAAISTPRSHQVAEVTRILPMNSTEPAIDVTTMNEKKSLAMEPTAQNMVPENFGVVAPGIYRSNWPKEQNFGFIETLGLKTILTLVQKDDLDPEFTAFMRKNHITHRVINMVGTKKQAIPLETMAAIMDVVADQTNYPLLIHCNHGKHRTGCVVGVYRHLSGWSSSDIVTEYKLYAGEKARECDEAYLANFNVSPLSSLSAHAGAAVSAQGFSRSGVRSSGRRAGLRVESVLVSFVMILIWTTTFYRFSPSVTYSNASINDTSPL